MNRSRKLFYFDVGRYINTQVANSRFTVITKNRGIDCNILVRSYLNFTFLPKSKRKRDEIILL